jgi:predicted transposase/invertase (TIGR01784 family)
MLWYNFSMKARYLNPFTDFGFKKLFGEEASKPLLKDFLNSLLPLDYPIADLNFRASAVGVSLTAEDSIDNAEQLGTGEDQRKAVYDIYCQDTQGNYFIVEMQKSKQNFFKDRTVFYTTFPIREQAERGPWNYELKAVYCVGILDFVFEEDKANPDYLHEVKLKNRHNKVFYDKYALYFIEMPKFHKAESELASQLENWLYLIKHLEELPDVPAKFQHTILERAFEIAELTQLTENERSAYEESLKHYWDLINVLDTARLEGLQAGQAKGLLEGKRETARQMKADGMPAHKIAQYTGLPEAEIAEL